MTECSSQYVRVLLRYAPPEWKRTLAFKTHARALSIPIISVFCFFFRRRRHCRSLSRAAVSFIRHLTSILYNKIDLHCHINNCLFPIAQFTFHESYCIESQTSTRKKKKTIQRSVQRKIPRTWKWKIQKEKVREHFLILLTLILNWVSIIINWNDWESLANYVFALKVHLDCYIVFLFRCGCCFVFEFHCNCLVSTNTHTT